MRLQILLLSLLLSCASTQSNLQDSPTSPECARACEDSGCDGWVEVVLDINPKGQVRNPRVVGECPRNIFANAALRVVSKWSYGPQPGWRRNVRVMLEFEVDEEAKSATSGSAADSLRSAPQ